MFRQLKRLLVDFMTDTINGNSVNLPDGENFCESFLHTPLSSDLSVFVTSNEAKLTENVPVL